MKYLMTLLVLIFWSYANAFTLNSTANSQFKGWNSKEINFALNTDNCPTSLDVQAIVEDAFAVWNSIATTNIKLAIAGSTSFTVHNNPTTIYCEVNFQSVTGADQNSVPGAASLISNGNFASGGLLYLNASSGNANIGQYDQTVLKIILAHEIGHILGLGHSHESTALMYYNAGAKETLSLSQDDVDGITYLYPRNEIGEDLPLGCGTVKALSSRNSNNFGLLLLILPLVTVLLLKNGKNQVSI